MTRVDYQKLVEVLLHVERSGYGSPLPMMWAFLTEMERQFSNFDREQFESHLNVRREESRLQGRDGPKREIPR